MTATPPSATMTTPNQCLDVEDDIQREERLSHLLQRTNGTASASHNLPFPPSGGPSAFDFGQRDTHEVEPPTQLLDRLQHFLPQMEAANAELLRRVQDDPESVDIEHLDDAEDGNYIEMRLGLGVFDVRRPTSERTGSQSSSSASGSSDDDASDSDEADSSSAIGGSDNSSENDSGLMSRPPNIISISSTATQRPTRPLPRRARPDIVVLDESQTTRTPDSPA
ncbi:hypothetical protein DFH11DRAFT_1721882 [Phellopilus nigrolimitatus]|nr:hypothetical protein DFH11DRAFT_1721882 [Phellopilus nigrolimitatus]